MAKLKPTEAIKEIVCGLVMPITEFGSYGTHHWREVRQILERGITKAGHVPKPVWEDTDTDVIQGRILKNLIENPIVLCDISGLNPNVMFELGLRIAFRKPIIIVSDDETKIPFDTNVIEHIIYDRNLKFANMENFIERLESKLQSSVKTIENQNFIPYLDLFGNFQINSTPRKDSLFEDAVQDKLDSISSSISNLHWRLERMSFDTEERDEDPILTIAELKRHVSEVWSLPKLVRLDGMWKAGYTATEIGDALGGVSRNAVIGKAHRMGLRSRSTNILPSDSE